MTQKEVTEIAKLCMWAYKEGFDSAIECLKSASTVHSGDKMMDMFVNAVHKILEEGQQNATNT